jgi:predicted O-methyltransferase YrrM
MDAASSLVSVDNDPSVQGIARDELRGDPRVEFVSSEGAGYLERCQERFDFIFADTWAGKYSALERCLELVKPGGFWVIDDMLPQPNWPEGHGEKAQDLLSGLDRLTGFQVTRLSWSTGLAIAVKR